MHFCKLLITLILDYNNITVIAIFVAHVSKSAFKTAWQRQQKLFNHQVKNKFENKANCSRYSDLLIARH